MLITHGIGELLHAEIGRSFDCHPDPAQETAAAAIPVHIELPGFVVTERSPGMQMLQDARGETQVVLARQATAPVTDAMLERLAPEYLRTAGIEAPVVALAGEVVRFTGAAQGEPLAGLMRVVRCPTFQVQIVVYTVPALVADLDTRVRAARCLAAGEAPPSWPEARP